VIKEQGKPGAGAATAAIVPWKAGLVAAGGIAGGLAGDAWEAGGPAAGAAAGLVGALFMAAGPRARLWMLIILVPFPIYLGNLGGPYTISLFQVGLAVSVARLLLDAAVRGRLRLLDGPTVAFLGALAAAVVFSFALADDLRLAFRETYYWLAPCALFFIAAASCERPGEADRAVDWTISVGAILAAFALVLFFMGGEGYTNIIDKPWLRIFIEPETLAQESINWFAAGSRRAFGTFTNTNRFALFTGMIFCLAVHRGLATGDRKARVAAALMGAALVLSFSRGGFLGLIFALAVTARFMRRRTAFRAMLVGAAVGFVILALPPTRAILKGRLVSLSVAGAELERVVLLRQGAKIMRERPLGVGIGNYEALLERRLGQDTVVVKPPHNIALFAAHAVGLHGAVLILALLAYVIRSGIRIHRRAGPGEPCGHVGLAVAIAVGWLLVQGLFNNVFISNKIGALFWLETALMFALARERGIGWGGASLERQPEDPCPA